MNSKRKYFRLGFNISKGLIYWLSFQRRSDGCGTEHDSENNDHEFQVTQYISVNSSRLIFYDGKMITDDTIGTNPFKCKLFAIHFNVGDTAMGGIGIIHGFVWKSFLHSTEFSG